MALVIDDAVMVLRADCTSSRLRAPRLSLQSAQSPLSEGLSHLGSDYGSTLMPDIANGSPGQGLDDCRKPQRGDSDREIRDTVAPAGLIHPLSVESQGLTPLAIDVAPLGLRARHDSSHVQATALTSNRKKAACRHSSPPPSVVEKTRPGSLRIQATGSARRRRQSVARWRRGQDRPTRPARRDNPMARRPRGSGDAGPRRRARSGKAPPTAAADSRHRSPRRPFRASSERQARAAPKTTIPPPRRQ